MMERLRAFCSQILFILFIWNIIHSAEALDIPLDVLTIPGEYHCFDDFRRCIWPFQYCHSRFKECRPCTQDVCSKAEEEIPRMCRLNCTISKADVIPKDAVSADFVQKRAAIWFSLMLIFFVGFVLTAVTLVLKHFLWTKSKDKSDEEVCLLKRKSSHSKATQTDMNHQEPKRPQTDSPNNHSSKSYCEERLKGTSPTNEDNVVIITTKASQQSPTSGTTTTVTVNASNITTSNYAKENWEDQTHSKTGQGIDDTKNISISHCPVNGLNHQGTKQNDMDSTPLKVAPSLNPSTLENDTVSNVSSVSAS